MSVTVTSPISAGYVPNGATTSFAFNFKIASAAEIAVYQVLNGVATLISPSAYSVVVAGGEGGTVTFHVAPLTGTGTIYLVSAPLLTQTLALANGGPFTPSILNGALDRAAIRAIFLNFLVARAIKVPLDETGLTIPSATARANKVAAFDNTGNLYAPNVGASDLEILAGITGDISAVAADHANVDAVAADLSNINTVAAAVANVNAVGGSIASVNLCAADLAAIDAAPTQASAAAASAADAAASAAASGYPVTHILSNAPPGYAHVFSDENGLIVGGITDQGVLSFRLMQAISSILIGTAGGMITISAAGTVAGVGDQDGNMPWFVGEDGVTHASATEVTTLNGVAPSQLALLSGSAPPRPTIPAQIIAAPSDGQSLSIGTNTGGGGGVGAVITGSTRFGSAGALMLHGGVRSWDPTEDDVSLVAAIETIGAGGNGETPQSGFAEFLNELLWKENGLRPADHGMQAAIFAPGAGATTIAQHQSGQSLFTRHHAEAQAIKSLATAAGKTCKKLATSWRQGESEDATSAANYANNLLTLRNSDAAATLTEFSQTEQLYYFCYQLSVPDTALQFYLATKLSQYIKIANPIYWMELSDGVHFTARSSKWDGAYHALMFKRLFVDGRKWGSVRPLRDVDGNVVATRASNQVTLTFDVPSGGQLTWDWTSNVNGQARQFGHYLFAADGTTEQAVTNIEIVGRNQVRLTCSGAVPANCIWRYGFTNISPRTVPNNGNMRDDQGDWLRFDGLNNSMNVPMHNWCVAFEETIA